ncbi:hypothetical protein NDU88_004879, partial [Pleurodeles waltl]
NAAATFGPPLMHNSSGPAYQEAVRGTGVGLSLFNLAPAALSSSSLGIMTCWFLCPAPDSCFAAAMEPPSHQLNKP